MRLSSCTKGSTESLSFYLLSDRIIHLYLVISEDRKWPKEDAKAKPTMVCSANDLLGWKDFPKGLKVLLLDEDSNSATEIRLKLEEMDYIVSTFSNENDALKAISGKCENFHVAIVEVSTGNSLGSFKFLETAKDLPIIMISSIHCLSTTMKCIALGAAEFLQKPLSEDKLRNIWQHVVHKAFNAGEGGVSKSLKPVKETVASILQLEKEKNETENQNLIKEENSTNANDEFLNSSSTLHLEKVGSVLDNDCFQDQPNSSIDNDLGEQERTTKFVDISSGISIVAEDIANLDHSSMLGEDSTKNEDLPSCSKTREPQKKDTVMKSKNDSVNSKKASTHSSSLGYKANKKKMKVDWTADLHKRFVQAVEQLGVDQAIPSRILELMKVEGLTRHNVASHLQKYRMNRRHVLPKEDHRRPWQHPKDRHSMQRSYQHRPIMAYPPTYHPTNQICSVWGHPTMGLSSTSQMWGQPSFATWQSPENWMWNIYPGMHMDAWGMPSSQPQTHQFPRTHNVSGFQTSLEMVEDSSRMDMTKASFESHPAEEEIDKIVKEALSKPWLPLPLGLKPPSTESVLSELQRQGISDIPPRHHYL